MSGTSPNFNVKTVRSGLLQSPSRKRHFVAEKKIRGFKQHDFLLLRVKILDVYSYSVPTLQVEQKRMSFFSFISGPTPFQ
jgi:hypothetical protein